MWGNPGLHKTREVMLSLMSCGALTGACLCPTGVSLAQWRGPDKMYVMLLERVQEAAELGLSTLPSVPALLLWCGAGWGREGRGCTGRSVSL